jgi:hypothetical protein
VLSKRAAHPLHAGRFSKSALRQQQNRLARY